MDSDGWKCMNMDDVGWYGWKWMSMDENGWVWMKINKYECKLRTLCEMDENRLR